MLTLLGSLLGSLTLLGSYLVLVYCNTISLINTEAVVWKCFAKNVFL